MKTGPQSHIARETGGPVHVGVGVAQTRAGSLHQVATAPARD
jgi:hypothetical protein